MESPMPLSSVLLEHAADLISQADALIVAAGAGSGSISALLRDLFSQTLRTG